MPGNSIAEGKGEKHNVYMSEFQTETHFVEIN